MPLALVSLGQNNFWAPIKTWHHWVGWGGVGWGGVGWGEVDPSLLDPPPSLLPWGLGKGLPCWCLLEMAVGGPVLAPKWGHKAAATTKNSKKNPMIYASKWSARCSHHFEACMSYAWGTPDPPPPSASPSRATSREPGLGGGLEKGLKPPPPYAPQRFLSFCLPCRPCARDGCSVVWGGGGHTQSPDALSRTSAGGGDEDQGGGTQAAAREAFDISWQPVADPMEAQGARRSGLPFCRLATPGPTPGEWGIGKGRYVEWHDSARQKCAKCDRGI